MKQHRGFRYSLQPALLSRQWELDNLKQDLAKAEESLRELDSKREDLIMQKVSAEQNWNTATSSKNDLAIDQLANAHAYLARLQQQLSRLERDISTARTGRDELQKIVGDAFRRLEALREHKEDAVAEYATALASIEFNRADDQWAMMQESGGRNDR